MKRLLSALLIASLLLSAPVWGATQTFQGNVSGNAATVTNLTVTSATEVGQGWTTPSFDAANFTGDSGSWTVEAGDVITYAYMITGKMMTVAFYLSTTTVATTPTSLQIKIPASKTSPKYMFGTYTYLDNGGAITVGHCYVIAANTVIRLNLINDGTWAAATNTTQVRGQITFEID